jgi:hypothetical protein
MSKSMRMVRRPLAVAAVSALALGMPVAAEAVNPNQQSFFGRMFPDRAVPVEEAPSNASLVKLAGSMLDPGKDQLNIASTPSGFTYFGQFIDHDLTLDTEPLPTEPIDPAKLLNFRTAAFDLDSVYGRGPAMDPQLYEADRKHLRVQEENGNGVPDLVRDEQTGTALLGDGRNDENLILAQLHVAFLNPR